jgi:hypothetical protein
VAIVAAVLVLIAPLLIAWVGYVLEQGQVNEVAHGTTLLRDTIIPAWFRLRSHWSWEVYRVGGWMAGCFMLWHLFIRERSHRVTEQGDNAIGTLQAVALVAIASTMMSIPYCMGRIDSKSLSRTGAVTTTVIGIMLPLVLLLKKKGQLVPATLIALFLMGIGGAPYFQSPSQLAAKAVAAVQVPKDAQWVNGRSMGLPKFGNTFVDQQTLESVRVIKEATDKTLRPGETYLDLTNHVGYYYLLDYKVPAVYAGYYTVVSEQIQNKVIRELQKNPPPLVWTGPVRSFGTGTASIRSYRLYRWLLQNGYVPAQMQDMSFLVRADRYREVFSTPPSEAVQVQQLAETFQNGFLAGIPLAWGSNMDRLTPRFRRGSAALQQTSLKQWMIQSREGETPQPVVTVGLECSEPVPGGKNDFLLLTVSGAKGPLQVRASWSESANGFAAERSLSFDARADTPLLVPLGSHPDWLMSRGIRKLSLDIIGMDQPDVYLREPPVFLSLVK